jgi:hypothetical protein
VSDATFFFSHTRQDRETSGEYLVKFYQELEKRLAQWTGFVLTQDNRLGTIDTRIQQGSDWDADLSGALCSDKVLVAILTPLYFNRPNCGKELGVFLLRSPNLGIDANGALTGVSNVMLIRWLPEEAYAANTLKDARIPSILRNIEDTPADDLSSQDRTQAIERYRKKGMEKCVQVEPFFGELMALFVARIRDMGGLTPAPGVTFATAIDAFRHDWRQHFAPVGVSPAPPSMSAVSVQSIVPRPLSSIVVFYVTRRALTPDPNAVDFADGLVAEVSQDVNVPRDAALDALLADVRTAAIAEGLTVFHAVGNPVVPVSSGPLLARLSALSASHVLTALVIDRAIWPGTPVQPAPVPIEQIIRSQEWTGPVLLYTPDGPAMNVDELIAAHGLPPRLVALPATPEARITTLRRAFIETRGHVLGARTGSAPGGEPVPTLKGVTKERG